MKFKTNMEIFEFIEKHLLTQNERSADFANRETFSPCRYKTKSGLKCAIGCLIPTRLYRVKIEGLSVTSDALNTVLSKVLFPEYSLNLLDQLQMIHDNYETSEWATELTEIRKKIDEGKFA
jgi:hypothetical protein